MKYFKLTLNKMIFLYVLNFLLVSCSSNTNSTGESEFSKDSLNKIVKQRIYIPKTNFNEIVCGEPYIGCWTYDENHRCKDGNRNIYYYKNGKIIESIQINENKSEEVYIKEEYLYENKLLKKCVKNYLQRNLTEETVYSYNNDSTLKEVNVYYYNKDKQKTLGEKNIYKYDKSSKLKEILTFGKVGIEEKTVYNYFDNNNTIEEEIFTTKNSNLQDIDTTYTNPINIKTKYYKNNLLYKVEELRFDYNLRYKKGIKINKDDYVREHIFVFYKWESNNISELILISVNELVTCDAHDKNNLVNEEIKKYLFISINKNEYDSHNNLLANKRKNYSGKTLQMVTEFLKSNADYYNSYWYLKKKYNIVDEKQYDKHIENTAYNKKKDVDPLDSLPIIIIDPQTQTIGDEFYDDYTEKSEYSYNEKGDWVKKIFKPYGSEIEYISTREITYFDKINNK